MAINAFVPNDSYVLMGEIAKQATGRNDLTPLDLTSFISVGETVLRTGVENTLNAITAVISRTIFSAREYRSTLRTLYVPEQRWGGIVRKITPLSMEAEASQDYNTNLNPQQLADGKSIDMYKINAPKALELHFTGSNVLQRHITRFTNQLNVAFHNPGEFMAFMNAVMIEFWNDVETDNEDRTRLTLAGYMGGLYSMGKHVVDFTAKFNEYYGTSYTRTEILHSHLTEFMQFFVAEVQLISKRLRNRSALYHENLTGFKPILRHTPYTKQRMYLLSELFVRAQASVFSEIFNPIYLELGRNFEQVDFWQAQTDPFAIDVIPKVLDTTTGATSDGQAVSLPFVIGTIFDEEAVGVMPIFEEASSTPRNAAGRYYNMFLHWNFRSFIDFTENGILFIMSETGEAPSGRNAVARKASK